MSYFGATGLNFCWYLLWVSKPECDAFLHCRGKQNVHPWDPPLMQHLQTSWWPADCHSSSFHTTDIRGEAAKSWNQDLSLGTRQPHALTIELLRAGCFYHLHALVSYIINECTSSATSANLLAASNAADNEGHFQLPSLHLGLVRLWFKTNA